MKIPATKKPAIKILMLVLIPALSGLSTAATLSNATNTLCTKIKSCATVQMQQQQLPPAMQEMMSAMLDETCTKTISPYADKATNAGLEKKAVACIESINRLSCGTLMQGSEVNTKACKALEKAANDAGIDTSIDAADIPIRQ